jgi:hypothetical protein
VVAEAGHLRDLQSIHVWAGRGANCAAPRLSSSASQEANSVRQPPRYRNASALPIPGQAGLLASYQNNIQGGAGSFTIPAASFADFGAAAQSKLTTEITGVPEAGSLALLGIALAGMVAFGHRRG